MLTSCDDPNTQKQLRRSEQIKKWNERENMSLNSGDIRQQMIMDQKQQFFQRTTKVRFPKGCVFLAACSSGDADEVKAHLKMGVNINTTNIDGLTALHQACIDANIEMVRFLVENNADINSQDNEGWTPLHAAVSVGNLDVSKYLINKGALLNVCNNDSDLPIDLCDASNVQMKEFLDDEMQRQAIDAEYERRKEELIMFEDAKKRDFEDKVQTKTGATALHVSAAKGYTRVMKLLLQSGANVNALDKDGWTPLHAAAHWEQEEACKILAENAANFEIKTFSDQSIYDVCDTEMIAKLKQLEANSKLLLLNNVNSTNNANNNNKLADMTLMNNRGDSRNRRLSDEYSKSSIVRLTNEAKSTISDREKKQEKILLSPIPVINTSKINTFDFNNSETENNVNNSINNKASEKIFEETSNSNGLHKPIESNGNKNTNNNDDHPSFDKENRNNIYTSTSSFGGPSSSSSSSTQSSTNGTSHHSEQPQPTRQLFSKSNNKPGLHENLKSLSAQVRMMEEDKEELISDKSSWISSSDSSSSSYKRRLGAVPSSESDSNIKTPAPPTSSPPNLASPSQLTTSITISNVKNLSPKVATDTITQIPGSPSSQNIDNRRYSSAPVASKDEQAELIRKQKAKLERHFRRSTTAVSYEDIKSAEATIKGTGSNSNLSKTDKNDSIHNQSQIQPVTEVIQNTTHSLPNQTTTSSNETTATNATSLSSSQIVTNSTSPTPNGVSSLSTLFGEPVKPQSTSLPASNNHNSSISVNLANPATINLQVSSPLPQAASYLKLDASPVKSTNQNVQQSGTTSSTPTSGHHTENAHLIANDIETDKLLNVIEKSKGFSDSKSTTARRLRNKPIVLSTLANLSQNNQHSEHLGDLSNSAKSKVQNLRWNEEKLELEVVRKEREEMLDKQNHLSPNSSNKQTSPTFLLKRQNSGPNLDSNNGSSENSQNSVSNHQGRQTYRFGQNTSNDTSNGAFTPNSTFNTNLLSRTNIKRSVSVVPTTDRRPLAHTNSQSIGNSNNVQSPSSSGTVKDSSDSPDSKPFDYQAAYELMKKENESLNQTIFKLNKELDESKRASSIETDFVDKKEKRAFDRKISELEEEVKKVDNLKADNNRLKEENAALIRVISKLSK